MKKLLLSFVIVLLLAVAFSSCTADDPGATQPPEGSTPTAESTPKVENGGTVGEPVPLFFYDYSDFLTFGEKGELDPDKYPNAEMLISFYKFSDGTFIDVKEVLGLPENLPEGMTEKIVINDRKYYNYYVSSTDESGDSKSEYNITVTYYKDPSDKNNNPESSISISKPSDMKDKSGTFRREVDGFYVSCYKTESRYMILLLSYDRFSINVTFWPDGITQAEIEEKFDGVIPAMFSDDEAEFNAALDTLKQAMTAEK